ncbi:MAG: hypothetical protein K6T88_20355 [Bacillus sp. (in: Bacteria)]|nr:hypothetical protein [Bacillus sp. (in: firmicutes)]
MKIKVNFFAEKHGKSYCDGRFGVIKRFIRDYTNKKEKKIKTTQDIVAAIQHMAATSKSRVQSAQIILNYEKMSPSKMVYVSSEQTVEWRQWMRQPAGWTKVAQRGVGEEARKGREGARRRRGEEKAR